MRPDLATQFLEQLEAVSNQGAGVEDDGRGNEYFERIVARGLAAIERATGKASVYSVRCHEAIEENKHCYHKALAVVGVVRSLIDDLKSGYVESIDELIHGELFSDFLEMAQHLQNEGYKDAAAVIAGSTLEGHLRQLCKKHDIDVEYTNRSGDIKPKKADAMNSELSKAGGYKKQDQKNITAWLGYRNSAAHCRYDDYTKEEIGFMIAGIRDFMTRVPA